MEKAASKKGVVFQAVKDVVQSLVDDSMVHVDKIGTSNWYWAFPGEVTAQLSTKLQGLDQELERCAGEAAEMEDRLDKAAKDHPRTEERQMAEVMLASATEGNGVRSFACGGRVAGVGEKPGGNISDAGDDESDRRGGEFICIACCEPTNTTSRTKDVRGVPTSAELFVRENQFKINVPSPLRGPPPPSPPPSPPPPLLLD
jgi:hypothetical protein